MIFGTYIVYESGDDHSPCYLVIAKRIAKLSPAHSATQCLGERTEKWRQCKSDHSTCLVRSISDQNVNSGAVNNAFSVNIAKPSWGYVSITIILRTSRSSDPYAYLMNFEWYITGMRQSFCMGIVLEKTRECDGCKFNSQPRLSVIWWSRTV